MLFQDQFRWILNSSKQLCPCSIPRPKNVEAERPQARQHYHTEKPWVGIELAPFLLWADNSGQWQWECTSLSSNLISYILIYLMTYWYYDTYHMILFPSMSPRDLLLSICHHNKFPVLMQNICTLNSAVGSQVENKAINLLNKLCLLFIDFLAWVLHFLLI